MSIGDLLFPQFFVRHPPACVMKPDASSFEKIAAPTRWRFLVDSALADLPSAGDSIEAWQPLGQFGGAPVLAPVAAKVLSVSLLRARPDAKEGYIITIEPSEEGEKPKPLPTLGDDPSVEELIERLDTLGVTQAGATPRLLSNVLQPSDGSKLEAILINAVDREPLLMNASQLLRERTKEIESAAALLSRIAGGAKIFIAVSSSLENKAKRGISGLDIVAVPNRYPENLDELAARRAVGEDFGKIAAVTLECALAALVAVEKGTPTLDRFLTVIAADGQDRRNVTVPLGMPLDEVLEHSGFMIEDGDRLLSGGQFQGHAESLEHASVDMRTIAVSVIADGAVRRFDNDPCIRCGSCIEICPMTLQPQELSRNAEFGFSERNRALDVDSCIGCGLCSYVCPSGRPLLQWIELSWAEIASADASIDEE